MNLNEFRLISPRAATKSLIEFIKRIKAVIVMHYDNQQGLK